MATSASSLRDEIAGSMRPVKPLAAPWRRAAIVLPVAALVLMPAWWQYGVRGDAGRIGWLLLWGASGLQFAIGWMLASLALRETIPAARQSSSRNAALLLAGIGLTLTMTLVTWHLSPTMAPIGRERAYWEVCAAGWIRGLPIVAILLALGARGFLFRPAVTGALAGVGGGLLADAGWRTICGVSDPRHVLSSHLLAIVLLGAIGTIATELWAVKFDPLARRFRPAHAWHGMTARDLPLVRLGDFDGQALVRSPRYGLRAGRLEFAPARLP